MISNNFKNNLLSYLDDFRQILATENGDWVIKGFIDVYKNIYTISVDTKVVSKIIEILLFPILSRFAADNGYTIVLSEYQNHYPDITLIGENNEKIALDIKSTYRKSKNSVNGFTLGAFTGYFRKRTSTKNITYPYNEYRKHFVLGVIYTRSEDVPDERKNYNLGELQDIISVINDFELILHEKWQIANDKPGSGNTKNIGSIRKIDELVSGRGPFAKYENSVFDDYWMNYLTNDMAKAIDSEVPYKNISEYEIWRKYPI